MTALESFLDRARAVTIQDAAKLLGLKFRGRGAEHPQPCPACGGRDTFAFNIAKAAWICRRGGDGGHDAIGMAAHVLGLDRRRRDGLLEACAAVLGEAIPEGEARESDTDRAARLARLAEQKARWQEEQARQERAGEDFRERERARARGKFEAGAPLAGSPAEAYLAARLGACPPVGGSLRFLPFEPYWHGTGPDDRPAALHEGPAMVAPFVDPAGAVIGCHLTWIDLDRPPKFRVVLHALTAEGPDPAVLTPPGRPAGLARPSDPDGAGEKSPGGRSAAPPAAESLPSKKMRGSKKGGLIPLIGFVRVGEGIVPSPGRCRMVVGEGIETVLAVALAEDARRDTIYAAAGDLGNLAGPAAPASRFPHPSLTATDRAGRVRSVMVAGPEPRPGQAPDEAFQVLTHVRQLVLLGDGDSERVMTAAALARARARLARPGLVVIVAMAPEGCDFVDLLDADPHLGERGAA